MTSPEPRSHLRLVWSAPSPVPARPTTLDRKRPAPYLAPMGQSREDLLRNQEWAKISARLSAYAFKRIRGRSWQLAEELAQEAIAQAWAKKDGWDPAKEPLLKYLAKKVIGLASNEYKRKRNSFERLAYRDYDEEDVEDPINQFPSDADPPDELLHRKRVAAEFRDRLTKRLAAKPIALEVITLMEEGITTPLAQRAATAHSIEEIRDARRQIFYHVAILAKELSLELDANDDAADDDDEKDKEVAE